MVRNRVLALAARALLGLALVSTVVTAPAAAASAALSPATSNAASLERAYEAALHVAAADVAGMRSGTLHTGSAAGREWAIASFTPAQSAAKKVAVNFQDGGPQPGQLAPPRRPVRPRPAQPTSASRSRPSR
jgi:formate-dependent phosphoribosylglycinamide formyltransferase (GAR transformylase)